MTTCISFYKQINCDMIFYTTLISVDLADYELFCAKICNIWQVWCMIQL